MGGRDRLVPEVAAARLPLPVAAAVMDQLEKVRLLPSPDADCRAVPAYAYRRPRPQRRRALRHVARHGMPLADSITVTTENDAAAAADRSGSPVGLKADVPGLVVRRKSAGAVLLDLHGSDEVRRRFGLLRETFGDRLTGLIIQAVAGAGPITHASGTGGPTRRPPALVQCIRGSGPKAGRSKW